MEFICSRDDIQKNISFAEDIVSTKSTLSILSNVLIETKDNSVKISSTDLEVGLIIYTSAKIISEGSITVQAKKMVEIIRSYSPCALRFVLDKNNGITISSEDSKIKSEFKIKGLQKDDYPKIPEYKDENLFQLEQKILKEMIRKTIYAVSYDEARYFLNGIFFEKKGNRLNFISTDGKRLAFITNIVDNIEIEDFEIIVPSKVLNELVKILKEEGICSISLLDNKIFFKMDSTELVSNLLEGQFPDYKKVIPKESNNILKVDTFELRDAIKKVSHMVDPKLAQIKFDVNGEKLILYGYHPEFGEARDELDIEYEGEDLKIAFNYNFLLDTLREVDQKEVFFKMTTEKGPTIIEGYDDENYFSVVMPMKLTEE